MKLDRLSLLLALVAATLQILTHRQPVPATEIVFLLFLIQITRALNGASFVRTSPRQPIVDASILTPATER